MNHPRTRTRVAIGAAVCAIAGFAAVGSIAASTEPPTSEPASSEPAGSAPALDPERETIVEQVLSAGAAGELPLNRDCIAELVAQVPDGDVAVLTEQLEAAMAAMSSEPMDSAAPDTMPIGTTAELSPEVATLGEQVIYCLDGDADPALVDEVIALAEAEGDLTVGFDMTCVAAVLSTFDDELLQAMIDSAGVDVSAPDNSMPPITGNEEDALLLLACAPDAPDAVAETVAVPSTPETTEG